MLPQILMDGSTEDKGEMARLVSFSSESNQYGGIRSAGRSAILVTQTRTSPRTNHTVKLTPLSTAAIFCGRNRHRRLGEDNSWPQGHG